MSDLQDALALVTPYLERYGYAAVVGALLLESFGLPLPGETMLIAGAALAAEGELHLGPLLACAWAAAVAGDNLGFAIGRFGGRRLILRYGARIGITDSRLAGVEAFFHRYGGGVVLFARFVALLRQLNGLVAGTVGMRWWRFLAYNAIGAALWVGAWGLGVYYFGQSLGHVVARIHGLGYVIGLIALVLIVAAVLLHVRRRRRAPG
ncbi:MAG TPA: DedA family protein [Geminicoccaceae bacterium]|nr:DedA family protein [Geminicoccaceae bacterium]HZA68006.1 DedA family protein [Geminicoccaceae bacterium]